MQKFGAEQLPGEHTLLPHSAWVVHVAGHGFDVDVAQLVPCTKYSSCMQSVTPCVLYVYLTFAASTDGLHRAGVQEADSTVLVFTSVNEHALAILNNGKKKKKKKEKAKMK